MKKYLLLFTVAIILIIIVVVLGLAYMGDKRSSNRISGLEAAAPAIERNYTNKEDNASCLKCHASTHVEFLPEGAEKPFKQKMYQECIIDTATYYVSNHWNFKCIDCHTDEYETFPHKPELRFEEIPGCMDCHGGDPQYEQFKFDQIDAEYQKSVHFVRQSESFTCWSCHDAHDYKLNARNRKENILSAIEYDNDICLSCHANTKKYQLIAHKLNPSILDKHDWLPNQPNHFKRVRCIECHAEYNDSLIVSHNILPKEKAVKKCAECHSANSQLMASLYKYQLEEKGRFGIGQANMLDQPVLIGGHRNTLLKLVGNIILLLAFLGVLTHLALRLFGRKQS